MKVSTLFLSRMLPVALALGTAWAARGQLGHEYGATWAAAIGIMALITISGRKDWLDRLPTIVVLGAVAWGAGGMISYGMVVGYGHATDYLNTSYGLIMLVVIGALYGFLGGGVTGLALSSTSEKKVDWASLLTQMFVGGYLFWGFFIFQLEWLMTPPRSELWAACMGAAIALGWFLYRNGYQNALRTAWYSSLGAGFGFGFGNFLQRMGYTSGIKFNWWNVMEYSIGFFGGLGMAYGVFSRTDWPKTVSANKVSNALAWVFFIVLVPLINLIEGVGTERMIRTAKEIQSGDPATFAFNWQVFLWALSVVVMLWLTWYYKPARQGASSSRKAAILTLAYICWYIVVSNVVSAIWLIPKFSSQHLYWINLVAIGLFFRKISFFNAPEDEGASSENWTSSVLKIWVAVLICILALSFIAVSISYVHPNAQLRFH